jgi:hypothetical protein
MMPNLLIMHVDHLGQKFILGAYNSHGWLRDEMITQNINGKYDS